MSYQAVDQKKEDFRKYLEKNGIIDALTKVLVGLYEEPEKPDAPLDFIKQFLGGPGDVDVEALKTENQELKQRVADLEARCEELLAGAGGNANGSAGGAGDMQGVSADGVPAAGAETTQS